MSDPDEAKKIGGWKAIFKGQGEKKGGTRTFSLPKFSILSDKDIETPTVTELPSQELKLELPQFGSETTERVFPVRSIVSYDSNPSSTLQTPSLDKLESPLSPYSKAFRRSSLANGNAPKQTNGDINEKKHIPRPGYLSQMHEQSLRRAGMSPSSTVPTLSHPASANDRLLPSTGNSHQSAGPYQRLHNSIKDGAKILKPIQMSKGLQFTHDDEDKIMIQSFGVLLVVTQSDADFPVEIISSNTEEIVGLTPDALFELKSICDIFSETQSQIFRAHAEYVLSDEYEVEEIGPEVFFLPALKGSTQQLWCTMHTSKAYKNYAICELEPEIGGSQKLMDSINSKSLRQKQPRPPRQFVEDEAPQRKGLSSTYDNPLQEADSMKSELLNIFPRIFKRISRAQSLDVLIQNTILTLQDMTKFHRITVYHSDGDRNGIVVAEALDQTMNLESFQGMHFQESTFPEDLKRHYLRDKVAFSYRKGDNVSELVYRVSTNKLALDLSHCYLTATPDDSASNPTKSSACACISISIEVFGKLWGLISCQSFDEKLRLHPLLHRASWFIGEAVSSNIERLSYTLPFQVRDQNSATGESTLNEVVCPPGDLLGLFGSDYAAASILGKVKVLGKPTDSQEVLALLEYLRAKEIETVLWSTDLATDFEDLDYRPGFQHLVSLLYIPLSANGHDFIIFFRSQSGVNQESGTVDIESRPPEWSATEFGKASMLTLLYRTFTEIWQEREVTVQNNQLMRLLLANAAHEFRTPLNAIINYLEISLDSSLNQETRDNLSRSHSASKSLTYIINDLLDLANAETGQKLINDEVFNLSETLCEATNIFWEEAKQKNVNLQVVQHSELPPVLGDQRRVRQVITNLISNAVQHTSSGAVTIESCIIPEPCEPGNISVEVAIHDTGAGMSQETVETLFCELEQVSNKEYIQKPNSSGGSCDPGSMESSSVLGFGLALVARIVRNMDGQLSLRSEEGTGSSFKLRLKFPLPSENGAKPNGESGGSCGRQACRHESDSNQAPTETTPEGKSGISVRSGDDNFPEPEPGQNNSNYLDVEIELTNGKSRSISLAAPHSTSDRRTKPIEGLCTALGLEKEEQTRVVLKEPQASKEEFETTTADMNAQAKVHILVAEDDPVNSTILKKRLEKFGYQIRLTGNGKECAAVYRENPRSYDAILMDLQMPIVDGLSATRMIREYEVQAYLGHDYVPIFAVSASLLERDRQVYMDSGFDGWIMKPIDFQRIHELLGGVYSTETRRACFYRPGMWEQGGWFVGGQ
ncbi:Signal transduction histidine-protein kinase BarA [Penicillium rolfsii]|nr:Signal transduction histidine-protein kinase BarA [Penicillium rolfsii]